MATVGIDLGTTNSLVSVWQDDKCTLIPNNLGEYLTPSVVGIDENGEMLVGRTAKERLISHPENTVEVSSVLWGRRRHLCLETGGLQRQICRPWSCVS